MRTVSPDEGARRGSAADEASSERAYGANMQFDLTQKSAGSVPQPVVSLAIAGASVGAAFWSHHALSLLADVPAGPLYLAAVALSAWRGGPLAGAAGAVGSTLLAGLRTTSSSGASDPLADGAGLILFALAAAFIVFVISQGGAPGPRPIPGRVGHRRADARKPEREHKRDAFLYSIAHELRTPVHAALGWTRILLHPESGPGPHRDALNSIERSMQAQARLIDDLLWMARTDDHFFRLAVDRVDFREVVDTAARAISPTMDEKGIRLHVESDDDASAVMGDADRLEQIVLNLLVNAAEHTPENGQIEVRLSRAGRFSRLTVYDDGRGIEPDFLPQVFEPFTRDGGDGRSGLGLGLAIVRRLAEAHGGTASASSAGRGRGSTFTVEIPLAPERDSKF